MRWRAHRRTDGGERDRRHNMMSDEKNARDAKRERRAFDARRTTRSCA
jgi:hypothetical protein